jgi:signal transduction histidine kinase
VTLPHYDVLYVDDDPRNIHAFRLAFKDQFRLVTAQSGKEALEILAKQPVAVLLADQRMPEITGAALCAAAKAQFPDVVRMIVTAYSDMTAVMEAINKGEVTRYFFKPWREEMVAEALRAGVEAYQIATLARDLQVRLLQQEQQATTTFLLGRVLHEIVSPAVGIRDNLGFLVDSVSQLARMAASGVPVVPRVASELVPALEDAFGSAEDLVNRVERFRQGETPSNPDAPGTSLDRAVHAAAAIVRPRLRETARLVLDTTEKASAQADATQLSQIIVNLLINACEAIEPGRPEANQITVSTFVKGSWCGVVIEDSGQGVPPELRDTMFEPFISGKQPNPNRGLGLAIVREIVEKLSGRIKAEHKVRGTSFLVELPRAVV